MNNLIGIDFSITSTAVCIQKFDRLSFHIFPRKINDKMKDGLKEAHVKIHMLPDRDVGTLDLSDIERKNSKDAKILGNAVSKIISQEMKGLKYKVAIEGLSFMSRSNIVSQFSGYHYILRDRILNELDVDDLYIFAPSSVKRTAGKGNFKKEQMIDAFIKLDWNTGLHNIMKNKPELLQNRNGKWNKPVDDLIDSFFVKQTLRGIIPA